MRHYLYKEIKKEKEVRKVSITEEHAKRLNAESKTTGLTYEKVKSTLAQLLEEFEQTKVIESLINIKVKVAKNIGEAKLMETLEGLSDDQLNKLKEELNK